ncbi:MAG: efflux transporter outer membrane subunit [Porphyrobacter sp.]|nr:efflux transporter outer membrane subunit [Porphyrobacter sp.]
MVTPTPSASSRVLRLAVLPILLASAGCASLTQTDYAAPSLPVEAAWSEQPGGVSAQQTGPWWDEFNDSELSALVDRVLTENADLAAAGTRLKQARLSADLATSQLLPSLSANLSNGVSKTFDSGISWNESASGSLGASWEVDLFGRLDSERDAAGWEAKATEQDLAATRLALAGTTVSAWWQLAYVNERIALSEQSLVYTRKILDLTTRQHEAGEVSRLDISEAEQSLATQEASLTQLKQSRVETRNALAALLGRQVYDGPERLALPVEQLPAVDAGIPAELLARRPDLAAAELRLRKTLATSDATVASYYPRLSLTGALGTTSDTLLAYLANPVATIGAALSQTVLNPDRIRLGTKIARADYEVAVDQFRQTFYDALRDTGNALSAREHYLTQGQAIARNLAASQDAETLYARQYAAGQVALRSWLDAQERLRSAEASAAENRLNQLNAQVALHQALGGDATTVPGA